MDSIASFLTTHKGIFLYFSIVISLPSVLLYCAECLVIIRHKQFHNSFYALFVTRAFTDLLYTFDSYYGYRIPNLFPDCFRQLALPNWALSLFLFLTSYTLLADNLTTGFILFNRLTAIACPLRHENIWSKLMPLALVIIFGTPFYAVGMLGIQTQIVIENDAQGNFISLYVIEKGNEGKLSFYMGLSTICSLLFLVYCTLLSLATLWALRRRAKIQVNNPIPKQQNEQNKKLERKLWRFAFLTCLGHMLIALMMIGIYLATITENIFLITLFNSQYSWVLDMGTVVLPSWLLLWASPSFRRKLFVDFLPKRLHEKIVSQQVTTVKASRTAKIVVQSSTRNR